MTRFTKAELRFLTDGDRRLGRLATIDAYGRPHVVPLGWTYNAALGTIDVSGRDFAATRKFRNAQKNPNVALVIDDVLAPWRPRCIMVQGTAETIEHPADGGEAIIRITADKVVSWGLDEGIR
ncbi:PPOX class F420-dependent oxidoreductase [Tenggerimyces flavus]|uniref:PPOX class F420-dependent oxidoreductase n=1 Tax=Tenggerimyces flavus TaxID=1708749 RepID=A0ABV7YNQ8_9ACTN|nr:PPOX class F420-dependent oxidoreductase [Tenggerimyces flavus]MBM7790187.1 pyridoxamine 5'-phosphate oxidase family protein [Tenggerimyces flavus]